MGLLENIKLPEGLNELSTADLEKLAGEIRARIIEVVSRSGGHLSTSLGTVELCLSLHTLFDSPRDKLIFDVGHQAYAHKILTGRLREFETLRQYKGMSGFPNKEESPHDIFTTGHAGTAISTALGIAAARDIVGENFHVVAVVGDGSVVGGMSLEAINNIGIIDEKNFIVILNDNEMSISKSVGSVSTYLTGVRTSQWYTETKDQIERMVRMLPRIGVPIIKSAAKLKERVKHLLVDLKFDVIFEELGFKYLGPIDGHNIPLLLSTLHFAKEVKGPVLVHILTKKGKGYPPAEKDPTFFHSAPPFDIGTGKPKAVTGMTYTSIFGKTITRLGEKDKRIIGISAAMIDGTGLDEFAKRFPERSFDVGIAEEHSIAFAAGLASQGFRPVVAIYSTFFQRAYDQIIHDVCLQNLPVIFALDRAGIVGEDGPTHNGVFDLAFLRHIPNMVVMAPKDENELQHMVYTAVNHNGPISIRYPKGNGQKTGLDA
jgi:1-deoxy-D-xylulose-5-phosphate synthase